MKIGKLKTQRMRRRARIRAKIKGTDEKPRLSVFRSNRGVFLQLVDDASGRTLASAGADGVSAGKRGGTKSELAALAGGRIAKIALEKKITRVVFDRGGYRYHGIVKSAADGARKGGLKF